MRFSFGGSSFFGLPWVLITILIYLQSTLPVCSGFWPICEGPVGGLWGLMFPLFELATGKHVFRGCEIPYGSTLDGFYYSLP